MGKVIRNIFLGLLIIGIIGLAIVTMVKASDAIDRSERQLREVDRFLQSYERGADKNGIVY